MHPNNQTLAESDSCFVYAVIIAMPGIFHQHLTVVFHFKEAISAGTVENVIDLSS